MPLYEYACLECRNVFIVSLTLKEVSMNPVIKCPKCDSKDVRKQIGSFFAKTGRKS